MQMARFSAARNVIRLSALKPIAVVELAEPLSSASRSQT
jgi:hypothetical protein